MEFAKLVSKVSVPLNSILIKFHLLKKHVELDYLIRSY